mmetsp:Transcript_6130/g.9835  ORF Transcript_6130/g.9835 Transcript_6130/m.9835 type:complete len:352 (+) Transcript_6130:7-1062(+)
MANNLTTTQQLKVPAPHTVNLTAADSEMKSLDSLLVQPAQELSAQHLFEEIKNARTMGLAVLGIVFFILLIYTINKKIRGGKSPSETARQKEEVKKMMNQETKDIETCLEVGKDPEASPLLEKAEQRPEPKKASLNFGLIRGFLAKHDEEITNGTAMSLSEKQQEFLAEEKLKLLQDQTNGSKGYYQIMFDKLGLDEDSCSEYSTSNLSHLLSESLSSCSETQPRNSYNSLRSLNEGYASRQRYLATGEQEEPALQLDLEEDEEDFHCYRIQPDVFENSNESDSEVLDQGEPMLAGLPENEPASAPSLVISPEISFDKENINFSNRPTEQPSNMCSQMTAPPTPLKQPQQQ